MKIEQVVWPSRVRPTRYACNNPTAQLAMVVHSACTNRLPSLKFTFSIIRPAGDLDLLTSNLVHIITRQVGNLPTNFGVLISIYRPTPVRRDLDLWPLNRFTEYSCHGLYHPVNFRLSRPFRSRVKSRHGTDTAAQFIMPPPPYMERGHNNTIQI